MYTHTQRERERERETNTHTHTGGGHGDNDYPKRVPNGVEVRGIRRAFKQADGVCREEQKARAEA
jgi:hypothetical protein